MKSVQAVSYSLFIGRLRRTGRKVLFLLIIISIRWNRKKIGGRTVSASVCDWSIRRRSCRFIVIVSVICVFIKTHRTKMKDVNARARVKGRTTESLAASLFLYMTHFVERVAACVSNNWRWVQLDCWLAGRLAIYVPRWLSCDMFAPLTCQFWRSVNSQKKDFPHQFLCYSPSWLLLLSSSTYLSSFRSCLFIVEDVVDDDITSRLCTMYIRKHYVITNMRLSR